ncbi:acetoacetyl-CoA synthetase [Franzmannia pantelleriensis]|uniref:Acetoacetyl-CoA synthetase n=1 Tax=Franzmannia pantelleriensis TaxID=48727 RepID=A0A1G9RXT9_9GAMM|nr:acetoacetate--CoA ligase [Halomonas pantelleriensis]SDM28046.1 acetoacetyl-CoA synthetase [Halomonas pantelleriensis]
MDTAEILWEPGQAQREHSQMAHYLDWLAKAGYGDFADYQALHAWSITDLEAFWRSVWEFCALEAETPPTAMLGRREMPGAEWLPGARLNVAANLLRHARGERAQQEAVVAVAECRDTQRVTFAELYEDVGAFEGVLREHGVQVGDRVAGLVANGYEALVAMLGAASLGAVWSSASPDFGVEATVDRFGQIEPALLVAVNGYGYGGKTFPRVEQVTQLAERLPSVRQVIVVDQLPGTGLPNGKRFSAWDVALARHRGSAPSFTPLPADHPLYILYSSGTTGKPKCIVHSAGGILLNHAKELMLHGDLGPGDRLLYFTTCGWMMWNWQASALLAGTTLVTYDGSPGYPDMDLMWRTAEAERLTHFGTSARFLAECRKQQLTPGRDHDLGALRVIFSTGSPLLPEDYDWVYGDVSGDLLLGSIAGGTDICGCFVGSTPLLPVRRGEIQCRFLGVDAVAYSPNGEALDNARGELVCRQPLPSMPVSFWDDADGQRYHDAYFASFPGVWAHGDFVRFTPEGGAVIYGRSDATLNPGGVRIGTAEIYRQVETVEAVADSLVVGRPIDGDVEVVLLVTLAPGQVLDESLIKQLRQRIRQHASPRHVPAHIVAVPAVPYTRSGKKVELAVARMLQGDAKAENRSALSNPESLDAIREALGEAKLLPA